MILERLREEKNYMSAKDYNMIAFDLREDASLIKSVVEDFGLFEFTEIDGKKFFYSASFLDRMSHKDELSRKRSEAGKASAAKRQQVLNICSEESQQVLNICNEPIKERKEPKEIKESKEKQSKENRAGAYDVNEIYLNEFFETKQELIEKLLMDFGMKPDEKKKLRDMAESIINEWNLIEKFHPNKEEWRSHLINTLRKKVQLGTSSAPTKHAELNDLARQVREEREQKTQELIRKHDEWASKSVSLEEARNSEEYKRAMAEA